MVFIPSHYISRINSSSKLIEPDLTYIRVNNPVDKMLSAPVKRQHSGRENLNPVHTGTYVGH